MEQSDGTFVAWAGPDESVGVDDVEETAQSSASGGDVRVEAQERPRPILDSVFGVRDADAQDTFSATEQWRTVTDVANDSE